MISIAPRFLIESLGMIFIAVIAVWMSLISNDGLILPTLGITALGAQKLLPTLQNIYSSLSLIMGGKKSLIDVLGYLAEENFLKVVNSGKESIYFKNFISIEGVSYKYHPNNTFVLSDVNLRINKGDVVGFIGGTGGGKSTLINIVMALLEPSLGVLTVDGVKISSFNSGAWQKHIGHVSQSIFLADSTVAENIAFGVPFNDIDMACVIDVAKKACIHDFIDSMPDGYLSIIGENGVRLSGGQRQRLGIARALYRHADVIVLDEATSALDYETEAEVMGAFENIGPQITQLIVAHRIQTLKKCTKIIQVNSGRIECIGSYQEALGSGKMIGDIS
jgi:ATP-binding cassette subfamily B protein